MNQRRLDILSRTLPFATYMLFIAITELLGMTGLMPPLSNEKLSLLYPIKILIPTLLLVYFRSQYTELSWKNLSNFRHSCIAVITGVLVYILWINLDWALLPATTTTGFDPGVFPAGAFRNGMVLLRIAGAVLIVPIFEELFWRSFLSRYLLNTNFLMVQQGTFTLFSFTGTALLFGFEHTYIVAGVMAGIGYNLLYLRLKSTTQCTLAHAVTNGLLTIHILATEQWHFW